jgi:HD superfamily phosphohydrolase YqeK
VNKRGDDMKEILLDRYGKDLIDGELKEHVKVYLESFHCQDIYEHTLNVVDQVKVLHRQFDFNLDKCIISAYLHDLGRVVAKEEMVEFCQSFGYFPLKGEIQAPGLLHQVASKIIAAEIFGVQDKEVLEAVACHTTLKMHPNQSEMVLFLADKLSWDEERFSYLKLSINKGLEVSMEEGIFQYFQDMHKKRDHLSYYHKLSQEAYGYFKGVLSENREGVSYIK